MALSLPRSRPRRDVFRCRDRACDLRFAHPQPTEDELAAAYARDFQPARRGGMRCSTPEPYARVLVGALERNLGSLAGRRILDFGAGTGTIVEVLHQTGARVEAIEPNAAAGEAIRAAVNVPVASSLAELAARNGAEPYDLIVMVEVVEHLRDPLATVTQLAGMLGDDGMLFVTTPNVSSLRSRLERHRWPGVASPTHLMYFTPHSLRRLLGRAGFRSIEALPGASRHPEHSAPRRAAHRVLHPLRLDGGIQLLARKRAPVAGTSRAPLRSRAG